MPSCGPGKIAVLSEVRSLVVILRDYASLWLRTKLSKASLKMEDFVGEYMKLGEIHDPGI